MTDNIITALIQQKFVTQSILDSLKELQDVQREALENMNTIIKEFSA